MISDEAIEAAAKAAFEAYDHPGSREELDDYRETARIMLEAAAPHMTERAYNAGHLDGMTGAPNNNPYRSQA